MTIIAVTGHREAHGFRYNSEPLTEFAEQTIARFQPRLVVTGMALGWDQAVAEACVRSGVRFIAAVPFEGQQNRWPEASRREYDRLLSHASDIVTCEKFKPYSQRLVSKVMQCRNEYMVDRADSVVALWDGHKGGTMHCVRYAERKAVPVTNVRSDWMDYITH